MGAAFLLLLSLLFSVAPRSPNPASLESERDYTISSTPSTSTVPIIR